jgi:hypothetical protein
MRLEGQKALVNRLEAVQDVPPKLLHRVALLAVRNQKRLVPRKTATLARSIHLVSVTKTTATTVAAAKYAAHVEYGTKPHEIRPRNKKALRFPGGGVSTTLSGRVRTGEVRRLGKGAFVFSKGVKHPGTKAQPYMIPGAEAAIKAEGVDGIIKAWNGAA